MNELTAKDLRRRAWTLLAGANGAAGYGTYVFGLLLNVLVVFVVILLRMIDEDSLRIGYTIIATEGSAFSLADLFELFALHGLPLLSGQSIG